MFDEMVRDWRSKWGVGEFPVYYAQIAPFITSTRGITSALFREAQEKCMKITPNTGMVVLMDSDSSNGIHPAKKKIAGERLAYWALAKTYGFEGMPYKSPQVIDVTTEGRLMILTFTFQIDRV